VNNLSFNFANAANNNTVFCSTGFQLCVPVMFFSDYTVEKILDNIVSHNPERKKSAASEAVGHEWC